MNLENVISVTNFNGNTWVFTAPEEGNSVFHSDMGDGTLLVVARIRASAPPALVFEKKEETV